MDGFVKGAVTAGAVILTACGNGESVRAMSTSGDCPPEQKGDGLMVSSRYNIDDLLSANEWRSDMFDRDCAGTLAALVPGLPDGYGVMPAMKPYIMNSDHIFLTYAEMKGELKNAEGDAMVPTGNDQISFEIVRFTREEIQTLRSWMAANEGEYLKRSMNGNPVYLMGALATMRPGKRDRIGSGLIAVYDSGLVVRLSHRGVFSQTPDAPMPAIVTELMRDIMQRAEDAGY